MKHIVFAFMLTASPLAAEPTNPEVDQGFSLLQEGAKLLLRGMASEVEPALKDMTDALQNARPQVLEILTMMGDITKYQAPQRLENGDILIRRKPSAQTEPDPVAPEIDL